MCSLSAKDRRRYEIESSAVFSFVLILAKIELMLWPITVSRKTAAAPISTSRSEYSHYCYSPFRVEPVISADFSQFISRESRLSHHPLGTSLRSVVHAGITLAPCLQSQHPSQSGEILTSPSLAGDADQLTMSCPCSSCTNCLTALSRFISLFLR